MGKTLRPALGIAWQYAKTECVPPMTLSYFHGAAGKKLENTVSNAADNFITGIEGRIKEMDDEEERKVKDKEAAIQAAQDKIKAEEMKKLEERKRQDAEKLALEAKKAKEKKPEVKAEKKPEEPKKETKKDTKKDTKKK